MSLATRKEAELQLRKIFLSALPLSPFVPSANRPGSRVNLLSRSADQIQDVSPESFMEIFLLDLRVYLSVYRSNFYVSVHILSIHLSPIHLFDFKTPRTQT